MCVQYPRKQRTGTVGSEWGPGLGFVGSQVRSKVRYFKDEPWNFAGTLSTRRILPGL